MCAGVIRPCFRCSASRRACSSASSNSLEILSRSMAMRMPPAQRFLTLTPAAGGAAGTAAFPRERGQRLLDSHRGDPRSARAGDLAADLAVGLAWGPVADLTV